MSSYCDPRFVTASHGVGVVHADFSRGQARAGVDLAPNVIASTGLWSYLSSGLGHTLHSTDQFPNYNQWASITDKSDSVMKNASTVSSVTQHICETAYRHASQRRLVLTIGGDHSVAIGSVSGVARAIKDCEDIQNDLAVIWVDAHADINTPLTSASGNIHGMPLAFLTGLYETPQGATREPFGWLTSAHRVSLEKLVYIGLRDVDQAEWDILRTNNIKAFTMAEVASSGIENVVRQALSYIGSDSPIHLGFDIDSLDPVWAPSTGFSVPNGLSLWEGQYIVQKVRESGQMVAMDLVEINPLIGGEVDVKRTIASGTTLIKKALDGMTREEDAPDFQSAPSRSNN